MYTGRLDRMLVDLLSFSRIGRMQEVREVELDLVLTEMLEEMRLPPGFTLVPELDTNLITIGERDIRTLLLALVSNAVKHHDRSSGNISLSVFERDEMVCITVSDDGPGIPEKFHEKVFGAMTTLRPRDEVEGSGMGLALVQKIARIYGGQASLGPMLHMPWCRCDCSFSTTIALIGSGSGGTAPVRYCLSSAGKPIASTRCSG